MVETVETVIIGAGQAGLSTSYFLKQAGREHLVLEAGDRPGYVWQSQRWDSFTFVTPNWSIRLPGAEYDGAYPDAFMPRREIGETFERYASTYQMPVRLNTPVTAVEQNPAGADYLLKTGRGDLTARNVVVATGFFQKSFVPEFAAQLPPGIVQMHASQYRNPQALPPGAVLVVGSAQSGAQIAEELYLGGRTVYLSTGRAGRVPRRYRGRDTWDWLNRSGFLERTYAQAQPLPHGRFETVPHLSGTRGGHSLNLHQFARDGVRLLGHLQGIEAGKARLAPDLAQNLTIADRTEQEVTGRIDYFIKMHNLPAPEEELPHLRDGFDAPQVTELDFQAAGIAAVIWATGFRYDFHWVQPAVLEPDGFPVQKQGVTPCPGLYFIGLPWQDKMKSGILLGVGEPAAAIAENILQRPTTR